MAKKKHPSKKHRFKYAEPTVTTAAPAASSPKVATATNKAVSAVAVAGRDFSYLGGDLRRLAGFGLGLIAAELVLWYIFGHTGLGAAVDGLVKI